jgi:hypothetical protein
MMTDRDLEQFPLGMKYSSENRQKLFCLLTTLLDHDDKWESIGLDTSDSTPRWFKSQRSLIQEVCYYVLRRTVGRLFHVFLVSIVSASLSSSTPTVHVAIGYAV